MIRNEKGRFCFNVCEANWTSFAFKILITNHRCALKLDTILLRRKDRLFEVKKRLKFLNVYKTLDFDVRIL